jgi:signal transduction histidine kinase
MAARERPSQRERRNTDEGLRIERANADLAIGQKRVADAVADAVLHHARDVADAVLLEARRRAGPHPSLSGPLARRDALADVTLRDERASADDIIREQRLVHTRILAELQPREREDTDRYLVTERARSDLSLSMRDDFLGMVSHDLRNLLTGIVLSTNILEEEVVDEMVLAQADIIRLCAARMNRLIGDLVDVSSIEAGKFDVKLARTDVVALVHEAVATQLSAATRAGIDLKVEIPERLDAEVDHGRLVQVLVNLVANALKFTSRGGEVVVRAAADGETLRFSVADSGSGIRGDMLESIFERFWRADRDQRGVGLGLYISRCIITSHRGKIWAESKQGEGSTFFMTIPRMAISAPP